MSSAITATPSVGSINWDSFGIASVIYQTKGDLPSVPMPAGHVSHPQEVELFADDDATIKLPQVLAYLSTHVGSKVQLEVRSLNGDFSATAFSVGYHTNPLARDSSQDLKYAVAQKSKAPHYMGVNPPQILATKLPDMPLKYTRGLTVRTPMGMSITGIIMEATLAFKTLDGTVLDNQAAFKAYASTFSKVAAPVSVAAPVPVTALVPASVAKRVPATPERAPATVAPAAPKKKVWRSPFATMDEETNVNVAAGGGCAPATKLDFAAAVTSKDHFDLTEAFKLVGGGGAAAVADDASCISHHSAVEVDVEEEIPDDHDKCVTDGCIKTFPCEKGVKRCLDCRKYSTRFVRKCKAPGCKDFAFTPQSKVTEGKLKYGDSFQPFSRCFTHAKAQYDSAAASEATEQEFMLEEACATEECEGLVQLTAKEVAFFESKGLEMPTRCKECIAVRKEAKKDAVECECEACEETFTMPKALKLSLEEAGKQLTCHSCRTTTTRNCGYCNSAFLTLAQAAWSKAQFAAEGKEWRAPKHCSKECKTHATEEATSTEGRTRNGKRK